mmetsp:Transcript_31771/g.93246  ORF Transcript_31771/g.93246 Transcript_31771/m.93246 type:complete len:363 (-) Transcript_31771:856-1944(-)
MDEVVGLLPLSASDLADGGLVQGVAIGDVDARFLGQVGGLDLLESWFRFGFFCLLLRGRDILDVGGKGVGTGIVIGHVHVGVVVSVGLLAIAVGGRIVGHDPAIAAAGGGRRRFAFAGRGGGGALVLPPFPFALLPAAVVVASVGRRGGRSLPSSGGRGRGRRRIVSSSSSSSSSIAILAAAEASAIRPAVGQGRRGLLPLPIAHDALKVVPGGLGRLALRSAATGSGSCRGHGVRLGFVHHVVFGDDSALGRTADATANTIVGIAVIAVIVWMFSGGRIGRAGRPRRRPGRPERRRRSLRPLPPWLLRHPLPERRHVLGQAGRLALRVVGGVGVGGDGVGGTTAVRGDFSMAAACTANARS